MRSPLTLVAVGDLQLGDSPTTVGYGFYSRYLGKPLDGLFDDVRPALADADIVFGNLETTLVPPAPREARRSALQLRGEPQFAAALRRVGFTVLNVANNHAVQHGDDTFHATVAAVRSAGIACCGVRGEAPWTSAPVMLADGRVGMLGYSLRPRQYGDAEPPYAEGSVEGICTDVERLKQITATVVVSLHWGEEFVPVPSRDEMAVGHAIIDAGAALVLGHHPHVTRPVEQYRSGIIAYSLGNFLGDMTWYAPFRRGLVLRWTQTEDGTASASGMPTYLADDFHPVLAPPAESPVASERIPAMDAAAYARAVAATVNRQRAASYRAALRNLPRTPPRVAAQLVTETIRNKVAAVAGRLVGAGRNSE